LHYSAFRFGGQLWLSRRRRCCAIFIGGRVSTAALVRDSISNRLIGSAVVILPDNGGFVVAEPRRRRAQSMGRIAATVVPLRLGSPD
jgi:hypothetical protein